MAGIEGAEDRNEHEEVTSTRRKGYHFLFIWYSGQCPWQLRGEDVLNNGRCSGDAPDRAHGTEKVDH
jgi:hypothetical protein